MPHAGGGNATLRTPPRHDGCVGGQASIQYLVPADDFTPFVVEVLLYADYHIALQLTFIFEPFFLHALLAFGACLPVASAGFITSNMDIPGREQPYHFIQHIFEELEGLFVSDTDFTGCIRLAGTGQLWIGCQYFSRVSRHFYFGDNGDMPQAGIFQNLTYIRFRIVASIGSFFILLAEVMVIFPPILQIGGFSPGCEFCQARIARNLQPPSGTVGQMPMQAVDFVGGYQVYLFLDIVRVKEVS